MILFTIIELFYEEDEEKEINHHGSKRIVEDLQNQQSEQVFFL